jgi:hypothetical protein
MPLMALKMTHAVKKVKVQTVTLVMSLTVVMKIFWGSVTIENAAVLFV